MLNRLFLVFGTFSWYPHLICQILNPGYEVYLHQPNISRLTDDRKQKLFGAVFLSLENPCDVDTRHP